MDGLKQILRRTYLGRLIKNDPKMGFVISGILVLYIFVHLFKLEVYPMYMFGMYSKKEDPKTHFHTYKLYENKKPIDVSNLDYRKYTVLTNTISQYDAILNNGMIHPETKTLDKFINRLHLQNTSIEYKLKSSFKFEEKSLSYQFGRWVSDQLKISLETLRIEKELHRWEDSHPDFDTKIMIYGLVE